MAFGVTNPGNATISPNENSSRGKRTPKGDRGNESQREVLSVGDNSNALIEVSRLEKV